MSGRSSRPSLNPPGVRNPAGAIPIRSFSAISARRMLLAMTSGTAFPSISHGARRKRNWMSSRRAALTLTWSYV